MMLRKNPENLLQMYKNGEYYSVNPIPTRDNDKFIRGTPNSNDFRDKPTQNNTFIIKLPSHN